MYFQYIPTLLCLFIHYVTFDVWVVVFILGPERLWSIPELVEVGWKSDGRLPNCADVQIAKLIGGKSGLHIMYFFLLYIRRNIESGTSSIDMDVLPASQGNN